MKCPYHPSAEMIELVEKVPGFAVAANEDGEAIGMRTVLRCSIKGCPRVAVDFSKERVQMRVCNVCGEKIVEQYSLTDNRCNACKNKRRRAYAHGRGPGNRRFGAAPIMPRGY